MRATSRFHFAPKPFEPKRCPKPGIHSSQPCHQAPVSAHGLLKAFEPPKEFGPRSWKMKATP